MARTGGSDAHEPDELMTCYTELPDPVALDRRRRHGAQARRVTSRIAPRPGAAQRRFGLF